MRFFCSWCAIEKFLGLSKLVVVDMEIIHEIEEFAGLEAEMLCEHELEGNILHGVDVVGDEHIIAALSQGCVEKYILGHWVAPDVKHGLESAREESLSLIEVVVLPEIDDVATIPGIFRETVEEAPCNIVLFHRGAVTLTNGACVTDFPVIPVVDVVLVFEDVEGVRLVLVNPEELFDGGLDGDGAQGRDGKLSLGEVVGRKGACDVFGIRLAAVFVVRAGVFG